MFDFILEFYKELSLHFSDSDLTELIHSKFLSFNVNFFEFILEEWWSNLKVLSQVLIKLLIGLLLSL